MFKVLASFWIALLIVIRLGSPTTTTTNKQATARSLHSRVIELLQMSHRYEQTVWILHHRKITEYLNQYDGQYKGFIQQPFMDSSSLLYTVAVFELFIIVILPLPITFTLFLMIELAGIANLVGSGIGYTYASIMAFGWVMVLLGLLFYSSQRGRSSAVSRHDDSSSKSASSSASKGDLTGGGVSEPMVRKADVEALLGALDGHIANLKRDIERGVRGKPAHGANALRECVICLERAVNVVLVPCGHMSCAECAEKIEACGVCRQEIGQRQKIFVN